LNNGTLTLTNSTVSNKPGDGIANNGTLTMTNSTVSGNAGGGIGNGGTLALTNSTASGNNGAGVRNEGGQVTVVSSTLSSNEDGVFSQGGTLTVTNSTVSGNAGLGIHSDQSETVVTHTTFTGNGSWGIWNNGSDLVGYGPMTVAESVVEDDCQDGPITSDGYNIESPGDTCGFDPDGTDKVDVTAEQLNLGPLADNSGPTMTHALEAGSVAIDVIPDAACEEDTDQRGQPRPETGGSMCDVGSFEVQP
jgi:hypothetical protein